MASSPGGALGGGHVNIQLGPIQILQNFVLSLVNFYAINIVPFPFLSRILSKEGSLELTIALSQYLEIDLNVPALL